MIRFLQQAFTFTLLVVHMALLCGCPSAVVAEEGETGATLITDRTSATSRDNGRQKRAPGWGKRAEDAEDFDNDNDNDISGELLLYSLAGSEAEKRAPGWGKRAPGWGKRAPGWGKRAPGWGKRAPGWGKRAPGWGKRDAFDDETEEKRAPGWGKRAPGWGKRAPGWGKRAPGWGKRAPGWGKRAPGWGKRSIDGASSECQALSDEVGFFVSKVVQAETRLQALCGSEVATGDVTATM